MLGKANPLTERLYSRSLVGIRNLEGGAWRVKDASLLTQASIASRCQSPSAASSASRADLDALDLNPRLSGGDRLRWGVCTLLRAVELGELREIESSLRSREGENFRSPPTLSSRIAPILSSRTPIPSSRALTRDLLLRADAAVDQR